MTIVHPSPVALLPTSVWEWYLDSRCTQHTTLDVSMFTTVQKYKHLMVVRIADSWDLEVEDIWLMEFMGIHGKPYALQDVLHLPHLATSLLY